MILYIFQSYLLYFIRIPAAAFERIKFIDQTKEKNEKKMCAINKKSIEQKSAMNDDFFYPSPSHPLSLSLLLSSTSVSADGRNIYYLHPSILYACVRLSKSIAPISAFLTTNFLPCDTLKCYETVKSSDASMSRLFEGI